MRASGILRSWNEERGFGFVAPERGGPALFVHISAFPRDGSKPVVGETVSFELGRGPDGRMQAVKVARSMVGGDATPRRLASSAPRRSGSSLLGTVVLMLAVLVAGGWGYRHYKDSNRQQRADVPVAPREQSAAPIQSFRCDGRAHCSQMTSCAEATWFINNCPNTQMDGNGDGVPCEQQWCMAPGAR
ncbi:cold shock domain-containing protein [Roseateles asaccharophilus]|uniref:Cold shock CspA family protein n=1 Tax=Roseateles asaccharophilus TaxID=582607 RepID=A0ABU2AII8_9BURK|nr:cold shock domain-containing protein [Roseateles asaccharophilus]MDR7335793.1 cold shock CspA family protein [Roseateles asaccharophilus]